MRAGNVQDPGAAAAAAADEEASERLFRLAAQYIVLAFALQPGKEVYRRSLGVVRELLPRPALRCGTLLAADPATAGTCHERRAGRLSKSCVMRVSALGMHVTCCLHFRVQAHLLFIRTFQLLECGLLLGHRQVGAVLVRCRPGRLPFGSAAQWPGCSHALAIPATPQVSHAALVHVPALNWPQSSTVYRQYAGWRWERWQP